MSKPTYKIEGEVIVEDNRSSRFPAIQIHPEYPGDPERLLEEVAKAMNEYASAIPEPKDT